MITNSSIIILSKFFYNKSRMFHTLFCKYYLFSNRHNMIPAIHCIAILLCFTITETNLEILYGWQSRACFVNLYGVKMAQAGCRSQLANQRWPTNSYDHPNSTYI